MCLVKITDDKPFAVSKDGSFTAWKLFDTMPSVPQTLVAPFQGCEYKVGETYTSINKEIYCHRFVGRYRISLSYLSGYHVFPTKHELLRAMAVAKHLRNSMNHPYIAKVKCFDLMKTGIDETATRTFVVKKMQILSAEPLASIKYIPNVYNTQLASTVAAIFLEAMFDNHKDIIAWIGFDTATKMKLARRHKDGHYVLNPKFLSRLDY